MLRVKKNKDGINPRVKGKLVKCHIKDLKVIKQEDYMLLKEFK